MISPTILSLSFRIKWITAKNNSYYKCQKSLNTAVSVSKANPPHSSAEMTIRLQELLLQKKTCNIEMHYIYYYLFSKYRIPWKISEHGFEAVRLKTNRAEKEGMYVKLSVAENTQFGLKNICIFSLRRSIVFLAFFIIISAEDVGATLPMELVLW